MGAAKYSDRRVDLIRKLAGTGTSIDDMAKTVGTSRDALRVWLGRHAKANGIPHVTKVYKRQAPAPQPAQPGA